MHPLLQTILLTVLVPAMVAGCFALAASWLPPGRWRNGMVAAGLAAAWCAGSWLAVRVPRWPAMQAADWQFYAVAVAGAVASLTPVWGARRTWRWLAGFAFFLLFFMLLLQRVLAGLWPGPGAFVWPAGLAALALVNTGAASRVGHSVQAAWTFFALLVFSVLTSALLALSGAASLAHGAGLMALACGGIWLVSWALRRQMDLGPGAFVAVVILGGLLVQGLFLSGLKGQAALVVGLVWPAAAGLAWLLRHRTGAFRATLIVVSVAGFCGLALILMAR
jgi:hypothetical protein